MRARLKFVEHQFWLLNLGVVLRRQFVIGRPSTLAGANAGGRLGKSSRDAAAMSKTTGSRSPRSSPKRTEVASGGHCKRRADLMKHVRRMRALKFHRCAFGR